MRRAMPTRPPWPLKNSQSASLAALAMTFTRRAIWDSDSPNTFSSLATPAGRMVLRARMAAGVMVSRAAGLRGNFGGPKLRDKYSYRASNGRAQVGFSAHFTASVGGENPPPATARQPIRLRRDQVALVTSPSTAATP